jgi:glycosyltransferase involved in cell wall biosynthesis
MKGKKVVVTLHSVVLPSISEKAFQDYFSESPVLRLFEKTKIVKIVTFFVNKLLSFFSDVLIYHSQCPFDFKNPKAIEIYHPIHEFRKKTKVGKKSKTVVFLGKIVRYKGFNLLVDAAEMLPELEFVIFYSFFDYRSKKDFEALRKARKLKNVVLEKNASDSLVEKTLKQAHCVVFPFINALGFSNALSKAIALKKVIVATDVGVFKNLDFVIKTECNAASLADGLRKAFSLSGNKYKKLLKRMKEYEKRANVQKFIFTHEEIYKKLEGN